MATSSDLGSASSGAAHTASSSSSASAISANDMFIIHFGTGSLNRVEMVTVLSGDCQPSLVSQGEKDQRGGVVSYKHYCDEEAGIVRLAGFSDATCGGSIGGLTPIGASSNVIVNVVDWNAELYSAGSYGGSHRRIELYCSLESVTSHYNKLSWTNPQDAPVLLEYHPNNYCSSELDQGYTARQYVSTSTSAVTIYATGIFLMSYSNILYSKCIYTHTCTCTSTDFSGLVRALRPQRLLLFL